MTRLPTLRAGAAGILGLCLAGAALAAPPCPADRPCDGPGRAMHARQPGGDPAEMAARHLERLKADLKITSAQESAWSAFAANAAEQAKAARAERDEMAKLPSASAPERLSAHIAALKRRTAALEASQAPLKGLYDVLSADQRAVFDRHGPGGQPPRGPGG